MPRVSDLLAPQRIAFLDDPEDVLATLCRLATRDAWERRALEQAVRLREEMSCTALDCGVAVPHGHVPELERFVMAVAVVRDGLEWPGHPAKRKVHIVILIGAPEGQQSGYLKLLSTIVKLCNRPEIHDHIVSCATPEEVIQVFVDEALPPPGGVDRRRR